MSRFFGAWELGGGLGHAGRLQPLARALRQRGHEVTLCLRDLVQTQPLLAELALPCLQAPVWLHRTRGLPEPPVSIAEILLGCGYWHAEHLAALVGGWLAALRLARADVVFADWAPTATLAARIAGVPTASVGMGFWMPPDATPIPPFRDWEPIAPGRVEDAERRVLDNVNQVLAQHGAAPLPRLAPLFGGDRPLLCTWPETDHYARPPAGVRYFGPNFLPDTGVAPTWPAGTGPRVFAYLKAAHPDHAAVLAALDALGCAVECYLPEVCAGLAPPVESARIHYASGPVDLTRACRDAQLVICLAGQATAVQALLQGVPLLLLPLTAEQFVLARSVERTTGAAINAGRVARPVDYRGLLAALLHEPAYRDSAALFAERYRGFSHARQVQALADEIEALAPGDAAARGTGP